MSLFSKILLLFTLQLLLGGICCPAQEQPSVVINYPAIPGEQHKQKENTFLGGLLLNNQQQYTDSFALHLMQIARYFQKMGNFSAASQWSRMALNHAGRSDNKYQIAKELIYLLQANGDFEEALQVYYRAVPYARTEEERAILYLHINGIFSNIGDYTKALQGLDNLLMRLKDTKDIYLKAIIHSKKGSHYRNTQSYRQAILENKKVYDIASSININKKELSTRDKSVLELRERALHDIGDLYLLLNLPDSALFYLLKVKTEPLARDAQGVLLMTIGDAYLKKKEIHTGISYLDQGLRIIKQSGSRDLKMSIYNELSNLYADMGHYADAWNYQKEYVALKDSLASVATIHRINTLETKFSLAQKDQELARKELLLAKQAGSLKERNWLTLCLGLVLVFLVILFLVSRRGYRNKQKLLQEKFNSTDREQKIAKIEAGIKGEEKERTRIARELHDGVVSEVLVLKLGLKAMEKVFSGLKHTSHYQNALQQSEVIALKLRQTAHNLMPLKLREEGLHASIAAFLKRVGNRNTKFSFQHYGTLPLLKAEVEKIILLMILELIQNIIKHSKATRAIIQLDYFEGTLTITAEDNGVGMPSQPDTAEEGMGLHNIRENIQLLQASIDIKSSEYTGTTVLIEIPVERFMEASLSPKTS